MAIRDKSHGGAFGQELKNFTDRDNELAIFQRLLDLNEPDRQRLQELRQTGVWRVPPRPTSPDTAQADIEWLNARRVDMPVKCFDARLKLQGGKLTLPRSYIYATRITPADTFGRFAARARREPGWRCYDIDASQSPNVTAPEALMALLQEIVA